MIICEKLNEQARATSVKYSTSCIHITRGNEAVDKIPYKHIYVTWDTSLGGDYNGYYAPDTSYEKYTKE